MENEMETAVRIGRIQVFRLHYLQLTSSPMTGAILTQVAPYEL